MQVALILVAAMAKWPNTAIKFKSLITTKQLFLLSNSVKQEWLIPQSAEIYWIKKIRKFLEDQCLASLKFQIRRL